mmetsp:Transcript_10120/g.12279  ORF Transcript_10120/g.12279 Transcript_10120/m.12279 type:complete len:354 (+) Transcript_10120:72-1133(+)
MAALSNLISSFRGEPASKEASEPEQAPFIILVIDASKQKANWNEIFQDKVLNNRKLKVIQTSWDGIHVSAEPLAHYRPSTLMVHIRNDNKSFFITPDAVLIRNEVYTPEIDYRNQLYGLMMSGVPSINSLHSIFCFCEKAVVTAELFKLNRKLGNDIFPVIPLSYFATHREAMYSGSFPCVVKIGSAHAGMGKMVIQDHHAFEDFRSVLAMTEGKYCTGEPFINGSYDLRIQKIGNQIRAFKRQSVSGNWKTNTGTSVLENIEVTDKYRKWAEAASTMFNGLTILSVDAIHDEKTGKEYILEVNGTSTGLSEDFTSEDNLNIRDLLIAELAASQPQENTDDTSQDSSQQASSD